MPTKVYATVVGIEVLSGTKWLPPNTILAWQ